MISQTYPDFYHEDDLPQDMTRVNTNPRYRFFRQNYFTAGDYEQFLEHWDITGSTVDKDDLKRDHSFPCLVNTDCFLYESVCLHDYYNTFLYIFEKFKKGLFMRLSNKTLKVFLPFSKINFRNEWSQVIRVNPQYFKNVNEMMCYISGLEGREFFESRVHKDVKAWYGNNGLVRLEFPTSEGDSGLNMLKDMFECLVRERELPQNCDFFVNKRDFPLLRKDRAEAYTSFFGLQQMKSHYYRKYAPILSMTTSTDYADIPIPTWEDWCRVSFQTEGKIFWKENKIFPLQSDFDKIRWEDKIPTAIFRGASTGLGTTCENNIRLFYAKESLLQKKDPKDGILWLDAGITKWNLRPRKHPKSLFLETIHIDKLGIPLVNKMTPLEQAGYKYILHLPGHSCAYRLSLELSSGSVVLIHPCEYELWYSRWLIPWKHYVPLDPLCPGDIYKKIKWCKDHDEEARNITIEAQKFVDKYLSREAILDYLQAVLLELSPCIRCTDTSLDTIYEKTISQEMEIYEKEWIQKIQSSDILGIMIETIMKNDVLPSCLTKYLFTIFMWMKYDRGSHEMGRFLKETLEKEILQSKKTIVSIHEWKGLRWISKQVESVRFMPSVLYSYFYLNEIAEFVPYFMSTYGYVHTDDVFTMLTEYIPGDTLEQCIQDKKINLVELLNVFLVLSAALAFAQDYCGFLHMDLYPWNVIMKKNPSDVILPWKDKQWIKISSPLCPVMIDYDRSFIIHNVPMYQTKPFYHNRLQDVLSIVFSCLHSYMIHNTINAYEQTIVLYIMNFFGSTPYTNHSRFYSIHQVRTFLKHHKKYSNMVGEKKIGLESKTPRDFIIHLMNSKYLSKNVRIDIYNHKPDDVYRITYVGMFPELDLWKTEVQVLKILQEYFPDSLFSETVNDLQSGIIEYINDESQDKTIQSFIAKKIAEDLLSLIDDEWIITKKEDSGFLRRRIDYFEEATIIRHILPDIPFLSSHLCKTCLDVEKTYIENIRSTNISMNDVKSYFLLSFYSRICANHDIFHDIWLGYFRPEFYHYIFNNLS